VYSIDIVRELLNLRMNSWNPILACAPVKGQSGHDFVVFAVPNCHLFSFTDIEGQLTES